jgi:hypothetical protein
VRAGGVRHLLSRFRPGPTRIRDSLVTRPPWSSDSDHVTKSLLGLTRATRTCAGAASCSGSPCSPGAYGPHGTPPLLPCAPARRRAPSSPARRAVHGDGTRLWWGRGGAGFGRRLLAVRARILLQRARRAAGREGGEKDFWERERAKPLREILGERKGQIMKMVACVTGRDVPIAVLCRNEPSVPLHSIYLFSRPNRASLS